VFIVGWERRGEEGRYFWLNILSSYHSQSSSKKKPTVLINLRNWFEQRRRECSYDSISRGGQTFKY
jgi:hypothetical protein